MKWPLRIVGDLLRHSSPEEPIKIADANNRVVATVPRDEKKFAEWLATRTPQDFLDEYNGKAKAS